MQHYRRYSAQNLLEKLLTAVAIIAAQKPFNQFTHLTDFIGIDFQIVTAVIDSVFPLNETRGGVKCIVDTQYDGRILLGHWQSLRKDSYL